MPQISSRAWSGRGARTIQLRRRSLLLIASALFAASTARAGDWHFQNHGTCSDCHTQHNSSGGAPMRTDNDPTPAAALLLRGTAQELCLSCHDGSSPFAPDVLAPVGYVADAAAGFFPPPGGPAPTTAHHIFAGVAEVPPGGTQAMVLTCTTCHDPHGNSNYRNLRPDPTQSSPPDVSVVVQQTFVADGTDAANREKVYVPSNVIYKSGVSKWCAKCHSAPPPGCDHPVDRTMWGSVLADYSRWAATTLPRVPVHSPSDNTIPSQDDEVNCLSCHKAHGSANNRALIYADGLTIDSTCQECHNQ